MYMNQQWAISALVWRPKQWRRRNPQSVYPVTPSPCSIQATGGVGSGPRVKTALIPWFRNRLWLRPFFSGSTSNRTALLHCRLIGPLHYGIRIVLGRRKASCREALVQEPGLLLTRCCSLTSLLTRFTSSSVLHKRYRVNFEHAYACDFGFC